jgi:hypothetical protein
MKIAATISDAGMALNVGGPVNQTTHIIDIPDSFLPLKVMQFLSGRDRPNAYWSMSLTLVDEEKPDEDARPSSMVGYGTRSK